MDVYEQEYRFYYFARCPYEKTDTTFRSIPLTTESFPQKEGGEAVWVLIIFTVSNVDDDEDYGYDPEFEDDDEDSSVDEDDNEPV